MMDCNESCFYYLHGCDMQCMDYETEADRAEMEAEVMAFWEAEMMDAEFAEWIAHMEEDFGEQA